jgi:hypothetical protein
MHLLAPNHFFEPNSSDEESDGPNPFDRFRRIRDALPNSSRSDTASSGRYEGSLTDQFSSSLRDRSTGQHSSSPGERSRNTSTWKTDTLPRPVQKSAASSSRHGRSRSDYSSSSRRKSSQRRHSPERSERRSSRAARPQSGSAGTMPKLSSPFASSRQPESVLPQLHDQRWTTNFTNYRTSRCEPTENLEERQREPLTHQQDGMVRAQLHDQRWTPSTANYQLNKREPSESLGKGQYKQQQNCLQNKYFAQPQSPEAKQSTAAEEGDQRQRDRVESPVVTAEHGPPTNLLPKSDAENDAALPSRFTGYQGTPEAKKNKKKKKQSEGNVSSGR